MTRSRAHIAAALLLAFGACGEDEEVSNEREAALAYLGLDGLVETAIDLGFKGMNSANGATIPPQMAPGLKSGSVTVAGKVDQGTSDNKNMDLTLGLMAYSHDGKVTYDTPAGDKPLPRIAFKLAKIPTGTLEGGVLTGDFAMSGDLKGNVTLNLTFTAQLEPDPTVRVRRKPGTTRITGTAVSKAGTYDVDITR